MGEETKTEDAPIAGDDDNAFDLTARPSRISVTIHRSSVNTELGVVFKYQKEGQVTKIVSMKEAGLLLLNNNNQQQQPVLQVGDILESVNEFHLHDQSQDFCVDFIKDLEDQALQTLVFVFRTGSETPFCQSVLVRPQGFHETGVSWGRNNRTERLYISRLSLIWKYSLLHRSDLVFAINGTPSLHLLPQEATELLTNDQAVISVLSCSPKARLWRRAAVGIGGGTLVGVGSFLMVTPLHPIGHAMALGGVGLLGTEFEGPRHVMEFTKKRMSWRRNESSCEPQETTTQ